MINRLAVRADKGPSDSRGNRTRKNPEDARLALRSHGPLPFCVDCGRKNSQWRACVTRG